MDHQTLRIADVGEQGEKLRLHDEAPCRRFAAAHAEREHATEAAREMRERLTMGGVRGEPRIAHPRHRRMRLQELGDLECVCAVLSDTQRQRLESLQEQERVERRQCGADVAEEQHAQTYGEGDVGAVHVAECFGETEAVIGRLGIVEERPEARGGSPVEATAINDHTTDRRAVSADPLGRAVQHDIGAMVDRPRDDRGKGVVHHQRHIVVVHQPGQCREVRNVERGIADGFYVHRLGVLVDRRSNRLVIVDVHEAGADAEAGQGVREQAHRAAIQRPRRHDVVAGLGEVQQGQCPCGLSAGHGHRGHATLERGNALLEDVGGTVRLFLAQVQGEGVDREWTRRGGNGIGHRGTLQEG